MEKYIYYNELYLIYKELLDKNKGDIFNLYYGDNLTLQEIADLKKLSKARIGLIVKNTEKELSNYENKLHLLKNKEILESLIGEDDIYVIKRKIESLLKGE